MSKLIYILSIILSLSFFSACGDSNEKEYVVLTSLKVNQPDKDLYIGDTYQLTTTHEPSNVKLPELTWKSSDTKVATVSSSGEVVAIADGVATITVSYGSLSDNVTLVISKIQDFTSFVFIQTVDNDLPNCIAAYKKDGDYYKLGNLGDLSLNKQSQEIKINDSYISEIFFFTDYITTRRFDAIYKLERNKKNVFKLTTGVKGIEVTDKTDPTQYPQ